MTQITYYETLTGRVVGCAICTEEEVQLNLPTGCSVFDGLIDGLDFYIINNIAIKIPEKPSEFHEFNFVTKQWVNTKTLEIESQIVKDKRNVLLQQSDWTQITNNPLSSEVQQQWATYRQQLRDITNQSGYPNSVIWPTKPE